MARLGSPPGVSEIWIPAPGPQTNGLAIASLVFGILWVYWIGSILALILGYVAKRQIDREPASFTGRGFAVAGIILGWVGAATLTGMIALIVYMAVTGELK